MNEIYVLYENKKTQLLPNRKYVIGRDSKCDIILKDKYVSRKHATLEIKAGNIILVDLNSVNGTWVEGKRISSVLIRSNTTFRIAENNLSIRTQMEDIKHKMADSSDTMIFEKKVTGIISKVTDSEIKDEIGALKKLYNQKKEKLTELAFYDTLTGIHNRRYFDLKIEEEVARATRYKRPLSLLMIDIDHFKKVNDTYGHQKGDVVLSSVAGILKESLRGTDIICRYGGEEIVVILPETDGKNANMIGENCRERIELRTKDVIANGVTVSIGVSEYYANMEARELIEASDNVLYQAKKNGRNQVVFKDVS